MIATDVIGSAFRPPAKDTERRYLPLLRSQKHIWPSEPPVTIMLQALQVEVDITGPVCPLMTALQTMPWFCEFLRMFQILIEPSFEPVTNVVKSEKHADVQIDWSATSTNFSSTKY